MRILHSLSFSCYLDFIMMSAVKISLRKTSYANGSVVDIRRNKCGFWQIVNLKPRKNKIFGKFNLGDAFISQRRDFVQGGGSWKEKSLSPTHFPPSLKRMAGLALEKVKIIKFPFTQWLFFLVIAIPQQNRENSQANEFGSYQLKEFYNHIAINDILGLL